MQRSTHHYRVTTAETGIEGLNAAKANPFEVILIDFDLPDLHGIDVGLALHTLMQRQRITKAYLVALTAQFDKDSQAEAERCGFDAFIGKPCNEADLLGVIHQL